MAERFSNKVEWTVRYITGPADEPFCEEMTVHAEDVVSAIRKAAEKLPFDALILTVECEDY